MGVAGNKWGDQDEEWNVVGVGAGWCVVEKDNTVPALGRPLKICFITYGTFIDNRVDPGEQDARRRQRTVGTVLVLWLG